MSPESARQSRYAMLPKNSRLSKLLCEGYASMPLLRTHLGTITNFFSQEVPQHLD